MKKSHFAPVVRKVEFSYNEQVVASGGGMCIVYYTGNNGAKAGCTFDRIEGLDR